MAATVRIARITAATNLANSTGRGRSSAGQVAASAATVRIAGITAVTASAGSATVRIADLRALSVTNSYIWDGTGWVAAAPATVALSVARGRSTVTASTDATATAVSGAAGRSSVSALVEFAGSLELTGGGTLTLTGGVAGPTDFFGTLALSGGGTLTLTGSAHAGPPGFGSVTVTALPLADPPRILLDLVGFLGTTATVTRIDQAGNRSPVRLANPVTLDAGTATFEDYEVPFGQPVRYEVAATLTVMSDPVQLDITVPWLIHPGLPDLSIPITVAGRDDRVYAANQGAFKVMGRAAPLIRSDGVRAEPTYNLTLSTTSTEQTAALKAILGDSSTLLLQIPADDIYEWVAVGDLSEADVVPFFMAPVATAKYRHWTLPVTVTDAPEGLLQAQRTLADLAAEFGTLQEIYDNYATLRDVAVDNLIGS